MHKFTLSSPKSFVGDPIIKSIIHTPSQATAWEGKFFTTLSQARAWERELELDMGKSRKQ